MKSIKLTTFLALLAITIGAQAQYSADYYHRVGDTVYTRSEIGYYSWWDFELMDSLQEPIDYAELYPWCSHPMVITPYFTATPLQVVGMAACIYYDLLQGASHPEYFYLFDNGASGPVFLDSTHVDFQEGTPHRYLHLNISTHDNYTYPTDSCCRVSPQSRVHNLYEGYFNSPVTVLDTFYVGWSYNNRTRHHTYVNYECVGAGLAVQPLEPCNDMDTFYHDPYEMYWGPCFFPWIDYYYCSDTNAIVNPGGTYTWTHIQDRCFPLIYPLIQIDTTVPPAFLCEPVQNLQATVLDTGSGCVFFSWDDFLHYTYCELQYYAPRNGIASTVDTIVSGANILHLCGLDTMLAYYVRARAFCDTSKIETDWSNWVPFSFPHTDPPTPPEPPQGIAEPSVLDRFTHLLPNPASDRVTVMSELGLHRIEVYNARGILVYSEPVGYSQATIDLRGWPAGQYMMSIETRRGKTTKRLVVAR